MKCIECGGAYKRIIGPYTFKDRFFGDVLLDLEYDLCEKCGNILLPPKSVRAIDGELCAIRKIMTWTREEPGWYTCAQDGICREANGMWWFYRRGRPLSERTGPYLTLEKAKEGADKIQKLQDKAKRK